MKSIIPKTLICFTVCYLFILLFVGLGYAVQVRESVCAGSFYPKEKGELNALIDQLTDKASKTRITLPADRPLKALIMPHAGYIYSGLCAAHSSLALSGRQFKKIIIMGPDHRVGFPGGAISDVDKYATPLGEVSLHPDAAVLRRQSDLFKPNKASDALEHSVEVEIPFLQKYLHDFQIIPIVMGSADIGQYSAALDKILDSDTLIVASSDLSHYLPYIENNKKDNDTIRMILDENADDLAKTPDRACGMIPILTLIQLAKLHHWEPVLIYSNNSGDTAGDRQKVVGYATIAFYGDLVMEPPKKSGEFSQQKGEALVQLARKTIGKKLGVAAQESKEFSNSLKDESFQDRRGTFVTLKIDDQLRGCIGNLSADKSILEGVKENAIHAAFDDPRFRPLSKDEFDKIDIEISLLTEPKVLEFKDADDLLAKLRPKIDGVILRKGMYSATFLPQVWDQLPAKEMFLDQLCHKAGLSASAWRQPGMQVMTYQVQYFEEKH